MFEKSLKLRHLDIHSHTHEMDELIDKYDTSSNASRLLLSFAVVVQFS